MIVIHWLSALLVLGAWLTAEGGREVATNPPLLHFTLGLAVLALVIAPAPAPGRRRARHERRARLARNAAKTGHGLHALMALWHQFVPRDGILQRMSPR